ncbi:MAG: hypothetical protein FWD36_02215 [Treponema sp.]|nr:hypothetical protein [Treponema sp.]
MKKRIFVLVLAVLIAGSVFAEQQANSKAHWLSGELSILGVGARYEYMLSPNLSISVNVYFNNLFLFLNDWGFAAAGRFYPWGKTFFAELGLGYGFHSTFKDFTYNDTYNAGSIWDDDLLEWVPNMVTEKRTETDFVGITGFVVAPGVGWKIDVGAPGGFYVQPGIKLPITFGDQEPIITWGTGQKYDTQFGVGMGFIIYCGLGYAF